MKVLVIGSGAREHALVRALKRDASVTEIHAAPGNAGIAQDATTHEIDIENPNRIVALATEIRADFVVIGPEAPLVAGAADAVRAAGIDCFGPSAQAANLEASKHFAKQIMHAAGVATARSVLCNDIDSVSVALDELGAPYVVKDNGLAAGKGVVVTDDRDAAIEHARACLSKRDGRVLLEEYLDGPEVSLFCVTDGKTVIALQPAQDFKRVNDGDLGPNTGGMGSYTPLPWAPDGLVDQVIREVAQPTVDEMAQRGTPFAGLLYIGLAMTSRGMRVVEFNARFGDPETQAVLAQLATPLAALLRAAATRSLESIEPLKWRPGAAVTVVIAAQGYPDTPHLGDPITGLDDAQKLEGVDVLHAGTKRAGGSIISSGGRVLSVVAAGSDLEQARARAYEAVAMIKFDGGHYRTDIAQAAAEDRVKVEVGTG